MPPGRWPARRRWACQSHACPPDARRADAACIDGLLGLGADARARRRAGAGDRAAERGRRAPVLAVDLPSGLDADRGAVLGEPAVRADAHAVAADAQARAVHRRRAATTPAGSGSTTLGVGRRRRRSLRLLGPPRRRRRRRTQRTRAASATSLVRRRRAGMVGAARLAARAALAAGAGRVYLGSLDPAAAELDAARPELMQRAGGDLAEPDAAGRAHRGLRLRRRRRHAPPCCRRCCAHAARLVLDADALNAIAADTALQRRAGARAAAAAQPTVLTPHPLEAARLLGTRGRRGAGRPARRGARAGRGASARWCVLKGSGTVVAAPDGRAVDQPHRQCACWPAPAPATCWPAGSAAAGRATAAGVGTATRSAAARVWRHGAGGRRMAAGAAAPPAARGRPDRAPCGAPAPEQAARLASRARSRGRGCGPCGAGRRAPCCAGSPRRPCGVLRARRLAGAVGCLHRRPARRPRSPCAAPRSAGRGRAAARPRPSRTMRKSILRPSRSTRLTCTRTRVPTP